MLGCWEWLRANAGTLTALATVAIVIVTFIYVRQVNQTIAYMKQDAENRLRQALQRCFAELRLNWVLSDIDNPVVLSVAAYTDCAWSLWSERICPKARHDVLQAYLWVTKSNGLLGIGNKGNKATWRDTRTWLNRALDSIDKDTALLDHLGIPEDDRAKPKEEPASS